MPILAIALICWIAAGCLGIGYLANLSKSTTDGIELLSFHSVQDKKAIANQDQRLNIVETVADYAKDNARMAKKAAEAAQKAIDDHVEWVFRQRALNEKAALQPSKPRRKAHDRER